MDASSTSVPVEGSTVVTEKRDLLARLLGRLAHEIRNPLSSLDIHVQLLDEDLAQAAPATRERLGIIRGELTRLEGIVKRFLRLASPSALEVEEVDAAQLVGHVCNLLAPEAAARGVTITTELGPELAPFRADGVQLTQALLNLVINALQALEKGGKIQIRVTAPASADAMELEVRDDGPGIPPGELAAVFEPYFTTKSEGSGLGLWIVQQIASAHGGTLQAANAPEGGAVFRLRIPRT